MSFSFVFKASHSAATGCMQAMDSGLQNVLLTKKKLMAEKDQSLEWPELQEQVQGSGPQSGEPLLKLRYSHGACCLVGASH